MSDPLKPGPIKTFPGAEGTTVPFYVIPFDKDGNCTGPLTLDHLVKEAAGASDVFVFSHGWNNDWVTANSKYNDFIRAYTAVRSANWEPPGRPYRPILAGVFWPSTVLVEKGREAPDIAGGEDVDSRPLDELATVAEAVAPQLRARFYELAQQPELSADQARELAKILAPVVAETEDEVDPDAKAPTPDELLAMWAAEPRAAEDTEGGGFIGDAPAAAEAPLSAGLLDRLKPLDIIRGTTVLLMKDRAGRVGAHGVRGMVHRLLEASPDSRVHLIGHSFGGKVVLSALSYGAAPSRPVESVLLLQPATSALCFAENVDGKGRPGGYRPALSRSRQAIMSTFSSHDEPLTKVFHFAARRKSDFGEAVIAGGAPSPYAALGGYGPQGADKDVVVVPAKLPAERYEASPEGKRIIAIKGDELISGHSDVTNAATAWALLCQVMH